MTKMKSSLLAGMVALALSTSAFALVGDVDPKDDGMDMSVNAIQAPTAAAHATLKKNVQVSTAGADCDPDVAAKIAQNNDDLIAALTERMDITLASPTKTTDIDCFSTLTSLFDIGIGFRRPTAKSIVENIMGQAKQAACNIALKEANSLANSVGVGQNLGGQFKIPGTNEVINVDAGGFDAGVGAGVGSGQDGITGTIVRDDGQLVSGDFKASQTLRLPKQEVAASTPAADPVPVYKPAPVVSEAPSKNTGSDLDNFLGNIF